MDAISKYLSQNLLGLLARPKYEIRIRSVVSEVQGQFLEHCKRQVVVAHAIGARAGQCRVQGTANQCKVPMVP